MSHVDSIDEETKRLLSEADSDDSKESKKKVITEKDGYDEYYEVPEETNIDDASDDMFW